MNFIIFTYYLMNSIIFISYPMNIIILMSYPVNIVKAPRLGVDYMAYIPPGGAFDVTVTRVNNQLPD